LSIVLHKAGSKAFVFFGDLATGCLLHVEDVENSSSVKRKRCFHDVLSRRTAVEGSTVHSKAYQGTS
jgi:hypothetical protein